MAPKPIFNAASQPSFPDKVVREFLAAAHDNAWERVQALVDKHGAAIVHVKDEGGATAIAYAARAAKTKNIDVLLKYGADIDAPDKEGVTPLMYAAGRGLKKLSGELLLKGAQMEKKDKEGMTALMHAAYHYTRQSPITKPSPQMSQRKLETIRFFIQQGADVDAVNKQGLTVEQQMKKRNNFDGLNVYRAAMEKRAEMQAAFEAALATQIDGLQSGHAGDIAAPAKAEMRKPAARPPSP